jgi:hypothetical protein
MRPLIQEYSKLGGTVGSELQAQSADQTIHRFRSSLSAIPTTGDGQIRSILHLIDIVGSYFRDVQLGSEFRPEPPNTFTIDADVNRSIRELVGRAINAGAFVHMREGSDAGVRDLAGARLRLAYTLAPEYKLPLVSVHSIQLSTILHLHRKAARKDPEGALQVRLPFGLDDE